MSSISSTQGTSVHLIPGVECTFTQSIAQADMCFASYEEKMLGEKEALDRVKWISLIAAACTGSVALTFSLMGFSATMGSAGALSGLAVVSIPIAIGASAFSAPLFSLVVGGSLCLLVTAVALGVLFSAHHRKRFAELKELANLYADVGASLAGNGDTAIRTYLETLLSESSPDLLRAHARVFNECSVQEEGSALVGVKKIEKILVALDLVLAREALSDGAKSRLQGERAQFRSDLQYRLGRQ